MYIHIYVIWHPCYILWYTYEQTCAESYIEKWLLCNKIVIKHIGHVISFVCRILLPYFSCVFFCFGFYAQFISLFLSGFSFPFGGGGSFTWWYVWLCACCASSFLCDFCCFKLDLRGGKLLVRKYLLVCQGY